MNPSIENPEESEELSQELSPEEALHYAIRLHQDNRFAEAEAIYQVLLELAPENPHLLHFLGMARHQRGHSQEGTEWIIKALALAPDYVDAQNNLGNIYLQTGHPELAEPHFRRVIELNPDFAAAYGNLGIVLKELNRYSEAIEYLLLAIDRESENSIFYQNLGNVYRNLKDYREAVGMYRKSLALSPFDADAYRKLSRTFYIMGEIEHCVDVLQQWLEHDPGNPTALHLYSAYTHTNPPPRASDAYVKETFDSFAASFDGVLQRLDYKAPFLVQHALQQVNPDPDNWQILDAGCGTGLCGALIRPLTKRLIGVDLSAKMLERAENRAVYDELIEAELTAFFAQSDAAYHAITCVDTFCYFGDLAPAIHAAVKALKPQGWFIFTLEKLDEAAPEGDLRLNLHGRYSHSETYLRTTLVKAGFLVRNIDTAVLRKEGPDWVAGLVVTAQLP